jgi:hypothetical protein
MQIYTADPRMWLWEVGEENAGFVWCGLSSRGEGEEGKRREWLNCRVI